MMYAKLFQPLWIRRDPEFRGRIFRYRRGLEQNERLSVDQMQALQWKCLKQLLEHAYLNVPFYRRRFDKVGLHPSAINTPEDWRQIPILTRNDVQANLEDLVATNCDRNRLHRNTTGGSTGSPMAFYEDDEHLAYHQANKLRLRAWAGFEMGDKIAMLWGADRDIPTRGWVERQRIRFIRRERWLNSFNVTPEKLERFARELIRWQPKYILAYASSAYLFTSFLQERGLDGRIRPIAVETSADKLHDFQRQVIEDVFQCRVFDFYGSREIPGMAGECEMHKGLHIFSDVVYLEMLQNGQPAAPGEMGEVIVTNLPNLAMPLIRYKSGDLARTSEETCPCGRPFPLLAEIVGRAVDAISTPNGQYIHGEFFSHLFYGVDGVRRYQAYQKSLNQITVKIESSGDLSEDTLQTLREKVMAHLGPGIEVSMQTVDAIPLTPTGKYRYVISEVPLPFVSRPD